MPCLLCLARSFCLFSGHLEATGSFKVGSWSDLICNLEWWLWLLGSGAYVSWDWRLMCQSPAPGVLFTWHCVWKVLIVPGPTTPHSYTPPDSHIYVAFLLLMRVQTWKHCKRKWWDPHQRVLSWLGKTGDLSAPLWGPLWPEGLWNVGISLAQTERKEVCVMQNRA